MTAPTLSDALRIVAAGGHVPDERGLCAASAWQLDVYVTHIARLTGMSEAAVLVAHESTHGPAAAEDGTCGPNGVGAPPMDTALEPGGHAAMWDGGGGWL